jgi:hypothetical protein
VVHVGDDGFEVVDAVFEDPQFEEAGGDDAGEDGEDGEG